MRLFCNTWNAGFVIVDTRTDTGQFNVGEGSFFKSQNIPYVDPAFQIQESEESGSVFVIIIAGSASTLQPAR
jgi:hypothetical protein